MKISSGAEKEKRSVGDRIRRAGRGAKLSQTALARQVGVTPSAVAQWEHPSGTTPKIEHLQLIANATLASFHWLATGAGSEKSATEALAVRLSTFAQDDGEEALLEFFRALSPRIRDLLGEVLQSLKLRRPGRRHRSRK